MKYVRRLEETSARHKRHVGGKGASLAKLIRHGLPVPPGYVVTTHAFDAHMAHIDRAVKHKVPTLYTERSSRSASEIQRRIITSPMPKEILKEIAAIHEEFKNSYVAVRSSATSEDGTLAAWAGQFETFLNTSREFLIGNIKKCWASVFSPRVLAYGKAHKQLLPVKPAVVVQKMVQSEFSGVVFSIHPVTNDKDTIIIEAVFGLGEAIVSGQVTPDSYTLNKRTLQIQSVNVEYQKKALYLSPDGKNRWKKLSAAEGNRRVLSDALIRELARLVTKIESYYRHPCDIEWAYEEGRFYITQTRPITTIRRH